VVWVAVFQRNILLASSGGCLKMEVVCFFRMASTPYVLVSVWKDNSWMSLDLYEVMKWRGDGVWYGIVVLGV
jgi:hypothetical protein